MIQYEFGRWGVQLIFQREGSVFPKAITWALPSALLAFVGRLLINEWFVDVDFGVDRTTTLWTGYTFALGFLLVFRTQIAYSRFWEGCSLLQRVKGSWVNAASSVIAFCSIAPEKRQDVDRFLHLLVRLMSMLFRASVQQVADLDHEEFEILGEDGISVANLNFLYTSHDQPEILLQWVQKLIVENHTSGVVPVPAPILSRAFQEISNGMIDIQAVKKINDYPFPFPYAQTISLLLLIHWIVSPLMGAILIPNSIGALIVTFATVFCLWSINFIAAEIELPFGEDTNDMPVETVLANFNRSLRILMEPMARRAPDFVFRDDMYDSLTEEAWAARPPICSRSKRTTMMKKIEYRTHKKRQNGSEYSSRSSRKVSVISQDTTLSCRPLFDTPGEQSGHDSRHCAEPSSSPRKVLGEEDSQIEQVMHVGQHAMPGTQLRGSQPDVVPASSTNTQSADSRAQPSNTAPTNVDSKAPWSSTAPTTASSGGEVGDREIAVQTMVGQLDVAVSAEVATEGRLQALPRNVCTPECC